MNSEQAAIMQVLCTIYHFRMNNNPGKGQLSIDEIRGQFDTDIWEYQFGITELYKRYAMRMAAYMVWM